MKALISPEEFIFNPNNGNPLGQRVVQFSVDEEIFPVAEPLKWVNCDPNTSENVYYDAIDEKFKLIPELIKKP